MSINSSSSMVELRPGQFIGDFNYPLSLSIEVACIFQSLRLLWKSTRREAIMSISLKKTHLFRIFLAYNLLLFSLCVLGLIVNEPSIHNNTPVYNSLVIAIMVVHTIVKALLCLLIVLRGAKFFSMLSMKWKQPAWHSIFIGGTSLTSFLIVSVVSWLVAAHIQYFSAQFKGDDVETKHQLMIMTSLNLCQIVLTGALVFGNTIMTLLYISSKLSPKSELAGVGGVNHNLNTIVAAPRTGVTGSNPRLDIRRFKFMAYMYSSPTAKLGVLLLLEELAQCFVTILIFSSTLSLTRSYVHGLNISFTLFSTLFYYSTFVDISKAIEITKKTRKQKPLEQDRRSKDQERALAIPLHSQPPVNEDNMDESTSRDAIIPEVRVSVPKSLGTSGDKINHNHLIAISLQNLLGGKRTSVTSNATDVGHTSSWTPSEDNKS